MQDTGDQFRIELDRRLNIILHRDNDDPARSDLSRLEMIVWFAVATAVAAGGLLLKGGL